ncbi:Os09g0464033 [Oryza sativa Japonica Group]|uniref:Os09g0464033 protein n=1 Tax=Oryza sativa subsp. japonica TaxID=39947 RepID=A0A0P0XNA5_ORYSJ|nr:Os09g0464033 [Oryza sativa Japonica Group]
MVKLEGYPTAKLCLILPSSSEIYNSRTRISFPQPQHHIHPGSWNSRAINIEPRAQRKRLYKLTKKHQASTLAKQNGLADPPN